jgi:hypothetical protein
MEHWLSFRKRTLLHAGMQKAGFKHTVHVPVSLFRKIDENIFIEKNE